MGCGAELQNRTPKHIEWDCGFNAATGQAFRRIGDAPDMFRPGVGAPVVHDQG
jgi:hypothetical protein